jgi:hypothetical protein
MTTKRWSQEIIPRVFHPADVYALGRLHIPPVGFQGDTGHVAQDHLEMFLSRKEFNSIKRRVNTLMDILEKALLKRKINMKKILSLRKSHADPSFITSNALVRTDLHPKMLLAIIVRMAELPEKEARIIRQGFQTTMKRSTASIVPIQKTLDAIRKRLIFTLLQDTIHENYRRFVKNKQHTNAMLERKGGGRRAPAGPVTQRQLVRRLEFLTGRTYPANPARTPSPRADTVPSDQLFQQLFQSQSNSSRPTPRSRSRSRY